MNNKNPRLAAALKLAQAGYKIFPVPPGTKKSYLAKGMKWGSGEAWGMTKDAALIQKYWKRWPAANIGLPTGAVNGVIVIETDTIAGHPKLTREGEVSLQEAQQRLGKLPVTLMSESPSGSRHRFYAHPGIGLKVTMKPSGLGEGIDVQGDNKMVVVPPSSRKDGVYRWLNKLSPVALPPAWIKELTVRVETIAAPRQLPADANWAERYGAGEDGDKPLFDDVSEALAEIPNEDLGWERWNDVGMRLYAWSSDLDGLELFDWWSQQSSKYDRKRTQQKWRLYRRTPPTRYTARSILVLAQFGFDYEENQANDETWEQAGDDKEEEPTAKVNGHKAAPGFEDSNKRILIPHDFWDEYQTPDLIPGLLPETIERLALVLSEVRGSDSAGLAMSGLLACGAAIPDCYRIQPKPLSDPGWMESARIWVTMVGGVASIKTSTLKSILEPFNIINDEMFEHYKREMARYNSLTPEQKKEEGEEPHCSRILISDSTSQGAQDIMRYNEDGLVNIQDELGHFYGSLDQFAHNTNSGSERFFWTRTFEGGKYHVDRANKARKFVISNCGMSLCGGIQPEVIRRYGDNSANDGLLQRSLFVMLKKAVRDRDIPSPPVQEEYNELILALHKLKRDKSAVINFTAEASKVRERFFNETLELSDVYGSWNGKLGEHISKWRGMFCRICLIIHITENIDDPLESNIDVEIAERVYRLFMEYLLPHSEAFYLGVLSSAGETSKLKAVAEFIIAHERAQISGRDLRSMVRATRDLTSRDVDRVFQQMYFLSWIKPQDKKRSDSTTWDVNPLVQQLYTTQASETRKRNEAIRSKIYERKNSKAQSKMGNGRYRNA